LGTTDIKTAMRASLSDAGKPQRAYGENRRAAAHLNGEPAMKKLLLGAVAAAAVVMPNAALADTNGHVAFSYNTLDTENDPDKEDYLAFEGAVATSLGGHWNLQFDAGTADMGHGDHTDGFSSAAAHLFARGDSHAFGGFAGYYTSDTLWFAGGEAAFYLGRVTLSADALYGFGREDDDQTLTNFGAAATFFVTDNFSVGVDGSWTESDNGSDEEVSAYGVNAEYQFAGSGFSLFGGYRLGDHDEGGGGDGETDSFTIGGRYNFGTATLFERDRSGASMQGGADLRFAGIAGQ
jgi:hypothetical protein